MNPFRLLLASLTLLGGMTIFSARAHAQSTCTADITGDGVVDGADLATLLSAWGFCGGHGACIADLAADGVVNGVDLTMLVDSWGCTGTVLAPTILSFSPSQAPDFGQAEITITGTNLLGTTAVLIGTQRCSAVTVIDSTTVTAIIPTVNAALPALFPVAVATPGGTAVAPVLFAYVEPSVTALPQSGPLDQPTQVTISASLGEFLTGVAASVYIEGADQYATDVVVIDAQTITAVLPANSGGPASVSLVVEQMSGKQQISWRGTNAFSYASLRYTVLDQLPDPTVITDASLRSAIIATGQPWRVRDDVSQLEFVLIPPGSYTMGCTDPDAGCSATGGFDEQNPPHPVTLTYPFYMARCEVSVQQFEAVSSEPVSGQWGGGQYIPASWTPYLPVVNIQWQDCKDWFLTPAKLRFANEAEWQYACKGGATLLFGGTASPTISSCGNSVEGYPNGISAGESPFVYSELDCSSADRVITGWNNVNSQSPINPTPNSWSPRPIGICPVSAPGVTSVANPLGLYDMIGNAQEWVEDWYTITSNDNNLGWYATMPSVDPGPSPIQSPQLEGQKVQCGGTVRPDYTIGQSQSPVGSWVRNNSPINNQSAVMWNSWDPVNAAGQQNDNSWAVGIRAVMDVQYPPSIQSVSPDAADASGGTTITVTGANLAGSIMATGSVVYVGNAAATNVVVVDQNTITATVPPGVVGLTTVQVVTDVGVANAGFAYLEIPSWAQVVEAAPDPAIVTDASVRAAIEATGHPWLVQDIATGIEMVLVPAGTYEMGCTPSNAYGCFPNENPVHSVTISQPTYVGRYEVTQAQWTAVMGSNPSYFTAANGFPGSETRPVESVSWTIAQGFLSATGMRLPTEAEWEYACRAGTTTAFHGWPVQPAGTSDDTQVGTIAWYQVNAPGATTQPVGALAPNGFGLYDMAGNVSEWCSDWYSDTAYGRKPVVDPQGPASSPYGWRVLRGTNIADGPQAGPNYARSSCRDANTPAKGGSSDGFRVVRNP
jgi:formylglycine-generating enzyme required for sulfatase activity